jgi:hypothetical protein
MVKPKRLPHRLRALGVHQAPGKVACPDEGGRRNLDDLGLVQAVFEKNGFENIRVYQHGMTSSPGDASVVVRRTARRAPTASFLHMGEPAPRKGGQMVFDTFKEVFGDN